jgi:phage tail-like protein
MFLHLNRDNAWPDFTWRGLDRLPDGSLVLSRVPLLDGIDGNQDLTALPAPDGPAGVAVGPDGTVYWTDPGANRILRRDGCDGSRALLPCLSGEGEGPGRFRTPRGLLFHRGRGLLLVADSGNHRVQLLDPGSLQNSLQIMGVWDGFDTPWTLAADPAGDVYVVDFSRREVQKFNARGDALPGFWENAGAKLARPVDVAVGVVDGETRIFVLDRDHSRIFVFDPAGTPQGDFALPDGGDLLGLLWAGGELLVGDNARRRLLAYTAKGELIGEAEGFEGPVAALAAGSHGDLWVHPGGAAEPVRLHLGAAHARSGVLWSHAPFGPGTRPVLWNRLQALGGPLASGAHLRLFFHTADDKNAKPPAPDPAKKTPFEGWQPLPQDALQGLVRGTPAKYLWVGAHFTGEGRQSPAVPQMRIDFDHAGYDQSLPAIYRSQTPDPELLARFLALFESLFTEVEEETAHLGRFFDPAVAPVSWLPWLAGWLGLTLDGDWGEEKRRQAIAGAFAAGARRGTVSGLLGRCRQVMEQMPDGPGSWAGPPSWRRPRPTPRCWGRPP